MVLYEKYMKSAAWEAKKSAYYSKRKKKCASCCTTESIHLHHLSYDNLGDEPFKDLMPLCDMCHGALHRYVNGKKRPLREGSIEFIKLIRAGRSQRMKEYRQKPTYKHVAARTLMTREERIKDMEGGKENATRGLPIVMT